MDPIGKLVKSSDFNGFASREVRGSAVARLVSGEPAGHPVSGRAQGPHAAGPLFKSLMAYRPKPHTPRKRTMCTQLFRWQLPERRDPMSLARQEPNEAPLRCIC